MKRYIKASSEMSEALDLALDDLNSDFDYIMEGLKKLSRTSTEMDKAALSIALEMSSALSTIIDEISNTITG